jgi:hypothetical protein
MIRWPARYAAAVALVLLSGCNRVTDRSVAVEHTQSGEASVSFDVEPLQSGDGSRQWIGTYSSSGKIARFRIDLGAAESTPGKTAGDSAVKSGEGTLIPEPGSDSSVLLVDLQKALRAKTPPKAPLTKTSVPFTYVIIGDNLSEAPAGGFIASPRGNWTALKLIFGDGDRVSEIFLHINAGTKRGQFSMKDPDVGDLALAELAKVL